MEVYVWECFRLGEDRMKYKFCSAELLPDGTVEIPATAIIVGSRIVNFPVLDAWPKNQYQRHVYIHYLMEVFE